MTARSSSHPPPRNASRTAQSTIQNLQNSIGLHVSAKTVQTYPQDISTYKTGHKNKKDALQHNYKRRVEKLRFYNMWWWSIDWFFCNLQNRK